jgi:DMSO/TMAO reductase YedYZ molybdopterin-dependent catalytic subunit
VGDGLEKKQMVGGIALIELMIPALEEVVEEEVVQETEPAPVVDLSGSEFVVTGMVNTPTGFTEETLRALDVITITAEHPKSGSAEYEGVLLSDLLDLAGVKDGATTMVITADDGFSAEISLAEVLAIPDCLLGFTETPGKFKMVMPGLPSSTWVKGVVSIELK